VWVDAGAVVERLASTCRSIRSYPRLGPLGQSDEVSGGDGPRMREEDASDPARCGVDDCGGLGGLAVSEERGETNAADYETAHWRHEQKYTRIACPPVTIPIFPFRRSLITNQFRIRTGIGTAAQEQPTNEQSASVTLGLLPACPSSGEKRFGQMPWRQMLRDYLVICYTHAHAERRTFFDSAGTTTPIEEYQ
jgi:hypothetical protein